MEELEEKHKQELSDLYLEIKDMMKKAKKSEKRQLEAKAIQMEFDLKAKHREEVDELENKLSNLDLGVGTDVPKSEREDPQIKVLNPSDSISNQAEKEKLMIAAKREKSKKKKDKKSAKELEHEMMRNQILASNAGVKSLRDIEIESLERQLLLEGLKVYDIPSDGNCLFRAIADQLRRYNIASFDHKTLRSMAASHMRNNKLEYAPFLEEGIDFLSYCENIESDTAAKWGGQLEIRALSECLSVQINIYSADTPVLVTGESKVDSPPIRLSFHRHLFTLGEHYNSVILI